jgi:hypothetical protein
MIMTVRIKLVAAVLWGLSQAAVGQGGGTEYQARLVLHKQFALTGEHDRFGLATWGVLPNLVQTDPFRGLFLIGPSIRGQDRWVEVMGGALLSSDGQNSPVVNVRYLDRSNKRLDVFAEAEYAFRERRWFLQPIVTTPLQVKRIRLRVGAEADFVFRPGKTLAIAGPRLTVPLHRHASFVTSLRFASDGGRVVRQYLVLNF